MPIPFARPQAPAALRPPDLASALRDAPLVLVADDHDDSRDIARLVLESAGYRVIEARTGLEVLTLVFAFHPSVILLDVVMPGLDGWAVARRLRADPLTCGTTIIALTALSGAADREESLAAGCDEVLTKPIHPRVLLAVFRDMMAATCRSR